MIKFTMNAKELKTMMDKAMTVVNKKKHLFRVLKDCTSRLMIREF